MQTSSESGEMTRAWNDLVAHRETMADRHLRELFGADGDRFQNFSHRGLWSVAGLLEAAGDC